MRTAVVCVEAMEPKTKPGAVPKLLPRASIVVLAAMTTALPRRALTEPVLGLQAKPPAFRLNVVPTRFWFWPPMPRKPPPVRVMPLGAVMFALMSRTTWFGTYVFGFTTMLLVPPGPLVPVSAMKPLMVAIVPISEALAVSVPVMVSAPAPVKIVGPSTVLVPPSLLMVRLLIVCVFGAPATGTPPTVNTLTPMLRRVAPFIVMFAVLAS